MENASKALIMAAAVLLGIMLLSLMVYVFTRAGDFYTEQDKRKQAQDLQKFNARYEAYANGQKLYATDIATLINTAKENNIENNVPKSPAGLYLNDNATSVQIIFDGNINAVSGIVTGNYTVSNGTAEDFINNFKSIQFRCTNIDYHTETGRVKELHFEEWS